MSPARQPSHVRSGLRVSAVGAAWTLAASAAGIWIGVAQQSVALLAFGVVGILDAAGSVTLTTHFALARRGHHRADHAERVAARLITTGLLTVGTATVVVSALRLAHGQGGNASWAAIALAAASLGTLTVLALRKRWVARLLPSHALLADSHLSAVGAVLAAVTLAGVVATRGLGWWWADSAAAIAIGAAAGAVAVSLARSARPDADELVAPPGGSEDAGAAEVPGAVTPRRYPPARMASLPYALSPSSISAFKECPLAFRFAYVDRLPEPPSVWTAKGTLVHLALQYLLDRPADDRTIDAAFADLDRARVTLAADAEFSALELSEDEREQFDRDSEELLRRYFRLEDPQRVHPIGLELRLEAKVGGVRIRGVIDRLDLVDGELVVTDYKTGAVPSEFYEAKSLAGVHMYSLLCEQNFGKRPEQVQLLYLSKPEAIIARPNNQSSEGLARRTVALWTAIEQACARDDFRPRTSRLCDFCTFRPYCPAHGGDPRDALELRGPGTVIAQTLPL